MMRLSAILLFLLAADSAALQYIPRFLGRNPDSKLQNSPGAKNYAARHEIRYFRQRLDHFSFSELPDFTQRYLVGSVGDQWAPPAPIFFYCGNEGDIEWLSGNMGFVWETAPRFSALVIFAEHRYYGKSMPFGSKEKAYKDAHSLAYFTSEQALADFATLLTDFKRNASAEDSPVVLFGGSYGGMLAAWMRLKYPHIAIAALAASAPILQFEGIAPQNSFYDTVSIDFKRESFNCFDVIKKSWDLLEARGQQQDGLVSLSKKFNLCKELNSVEQLSDWLQAAYTYLAMGNYPFASNFFMPLPAYPIKEACKQVDGFLNDADILDNIFSIASVYYNYTGTFDCFDLEYDPHGLKGWIWQTCTELVMPLSISKDNSMLPPYRFNVSEFTDGCIKSYGVRPRPTWVTTQFGGHDIRTVLKNFGSNIIFSNGLADPWSAGGVLRNISHSIVALVTELGAHHIDLLSSTKDDPVLMSVSPLAIMAISSSLMKWFRMKSRAMTPCTHSSVNFTESRDYILRALLPGRRLERQWETTEYPSAEKRRSLGWFSS